MDKNILKLWIYNIYLYKEHTCGQDHTVGRHLLGMPQILIQAMKTRQKSPTVSNCQMHFFPVSDNEYVVYFAVDK